MCLYFPQIKKRHFLFPAIILMPVWTMYTVWAGDIHLNCLSLGYRSKVSDLLWWWRGCEQTKDLYELCIWLLGNSKDKARLLDCGGKGHLIQAVCTVANRKAVHCRVYCWNCKAEHLPKSILCSKPMVGALPSLSEYTEVQFKFYKHRIRTPFIWKWVSECLNA